MMIDRLTEALTKGDAMASYAKVEATASRYGATLDYSSDSIAADLPVGTVWRCNGERTILVVETSNTAASLAVLLADMSMGTRPALPCEIMADTEAEEGI